MRFTHCMLLALALALTFTLVDPAPARAQTAPPQVTELEPVVVAPARPRRRARIGSELLAGTAMEIGMYVSGGLFGALVGAAVGNALNPGGPYCISICNGAAIGMFVGTGIAAGLTVIHLMPYVVYRRGTSRGGHGSYLATALGAFVATVAVVPGVLALGLGVRPEVGAVFGIVGGLTAPVVGAVTGYELSSARAERQGLVARGGTRAPVSWAPMVWASDRGAVVGLAGVF